jgi:hypothetical protein
LTEDCKTRRNEKGGAPCSPGGITRIESHLPLRIALKNVKHSFSKTGGMYPGYKQGTRYEKGQNNNRQSDDLTSPGKSKEKGKETNLDL